MADVKVNRPSSEEKGRPGGEMARQTESTPSLFSLSPGDVFSASPFDLMRRFANEVDRMWGWERPRGQMRLWNPAVEVRQERDSLRICADLPGLTKDDVKIEATDEGLVIQGERKQESKEEREGFYRSERSYGKFYRVIPLPEEAKIDQARAQFNNGVLEVTVPCPAAEQKRREIPIEAGEKARTSGGGA